MWMVGLLGSRRGEGGRGAEVVNVESRGVGREEKRLRGEGMDQGCWVRNGTVRIRGCQYN